MKVELLNKSHHRQSFECEEKALSDYLKRYVGQDVKKGLALCFVVTNSNNQVIGYYTLSSESLGRDSIPEKFLRKLPRHYNAPVILLGRLARDLSQKGKGLGEFLLMDALFRAFEVSEKSLGAMAVVVDPINEIAHNFYMKYGFSQLPGSGKMFLPMGIIKKLT